MSDQMQSNDPVHYRRFFENCRLCPRRCGVNRSKNLQKAKLGFCGETEQLRVAYIGPHFGEEPPICGEKGSGTIFFSGCSLRCAFCQNHQISHKGRGNPITVNLLAERVVEMIVSRRVHNINFVTPDHFFPQVFGLVSVLRKKGFKLPMVYNLSGYQSKEWIKSAEDYADIYLPDFKYMDLSLAGALSRCPDYTGTALEAIAEMVRQKGFLDSCLFDRPHAQKGVLVRHLVLPGYVENSINSLTSLFVEFGPDLPISLMSQYFPAIRQTQESLNRHVLDAEFQRVYEHTEELGFRNLFIQFPPKEKDRQSSFLPDFSKKEPFSLYYT
jgi:putative pyruvate formate lyase activating enzyme